MILHYIKYLTFAKILNALKVYFSYLISKFLSKNIRWGLPISISIEPTTACNLGCPECPSGLKSFTRDTGNLKYDSFIKVIEDCKQHVSYLTFYFQGEPYINPKFLDMVHYAHQTNLYTMTSTNAHFLSMENAIKTVQSGLDRILISLDGTDQTTYESYRKGGDLSKVIEGTKNLIAARKKLNASHPQIIFQFLVVKPNEHQIVDVQELANDLGVDAVRFKTAQIYDYQNGNNLMPSIDKYSRYKKDKQGIYQIKNRLANNCWKLWHSCVITWDGNVVPCCFDKDAKYKMGNAFRTSLKKIWTNKHYNTFRESLIKSRKEIDICTNCSEGTKVWE